MKRNKKILLTLGTLASVVAPVAAVVSCGTQEVRHFGILPTYTGQADQLIALGIHADYYPMQLNVQKPYEYLTNPGQYMTQQDSGFKTSFTNALKGLMPKTQGVSWWNQDAKDSDDSRVSNTYWQKQEGSVLLYEHYLLDDGQKVVTAAWAPKHHSQTAIQTNFRASRDPYTRIQKGVFFGWDLSNKTLETIASTDASSLKTIDDISVTDSTHNEKSYVADEAGTTATAKDKFTVSGGVVTSNLISGTPVVITQDSAKIIIAMRKKRAELLNSDTGESDWFYNDWFFVDSFHRTYLDNADFQNSEFKAWIVDSTTQNPFETVARQGSAAGTLKSDQAGLKALFDASTFQKDEIKNGISPTSSVATSPHHPIYEQQEGNIGAAPMFEGAERDNQLYLFNVAWQVSNLAKTGTPYGDAFVKSLPEHTPAGQAADFSVARSQDEAKQIKAYVASQVSADQLAEMSSALDNANLITNQLKTRMAAIKAYLSDLGVAGKTFGLLTIAPGKGVSTLQTNSKYSFIYNELGLSQPIPKNLDALAEGATKFTAGWDKKAGTNKFMEEDDKGDYVVKGDAVADVTAAVGANSLFNMDDNGWFWALGTSEAEGNGLDDAKLQKFKGQIDFGVIASHDANYTAEIENNNGIAQSVAKMFTSYTAGADADKSAQAFDLALRGANKEADYDLWNEGLKTPFVMDMLLDQIMTKAEEYAAAKASKTIDTLRADHKTNYEAAKNWGEYFTKDFIK